MSGICFGGLTVWDMHQCGMHALELEAISSTGEKGRVEVKYGLGLTVVSGVVACVAGTIAIWITTGREVERRSQVDRDMYIRLSISSSILAAGVCAMHYLGMWSMSGNFKMEWDAGIIATSYLIAHTAAGAGLVMLMVFPNSTAVHVLAASVIGFAVCGMHYTGMYAANYTISMQEDPGIGETAYTITGIEVVAACLMANLVVTIVLHHYSEGQRVHFVSAVHQKHAQELQSVIDLSYKVANALVNYDLAAAETLLEGSNEEMMQPLQLLMRNLRVYRSFLPHALFDKSEIVANLPNEILSSQLELAKTSLKDVHIAIDRIRDPSYTLKMFHEHMTNAYPELVLYTMGSDKCSSGNTGVEEYQRTMGALYTVFALLRLDIDGKHLMSFGVNANGYPRVTPFEQSEGREVADKKMKFLTLLDWDRLRDLMVRAGILTYDVTGAVSLVKERAVGMLTLTAIHDIMKNNALLPRVQPGHAPYYGYALGEEIADHDIALAYILENYPALLPSFGSLSPAQRAPVLFTQAKMNFNNGWLVQGEAPPGALFRSFKAAIRQGRANASDVSFYFVHWITDLAGAEAYGERPWPGAEKFTLKLPPHVLMSFLNSFSFVEQLAESSEVQVMEDYLQHRFRTLKLQMPAQLGPEFFIASARLALMAQGFEQHVLAALELLVDDDKETLAAELSRTGCREQFTNAPPQVANRTLGPAILIYYAPALLQNAGMHEAQGALIILAAVFRAARVIFPLDSHSFDQTVTVRIDAMKAVKPGDIMRRQPWMLKRTSAISAEVLSSEVASFPAATPSIAGSVSHSGAGSATRDGPEAGLVMVELPYLLHRTPSFEV
eukprot:CAMPEP_0178452426 /NCGR_PEP_ID=MMETSP0689_2-20121128/44237_1 /TAXON_ID=160604 /ORGANISM="Amphidinium massartii, Strain CS-259" /LENGTH=837 /DNA_ID=CAMNT_0020078129 /DNA_START=229 /DNA_END=2742 /DNA_ORIENTATION=-